MRSCSVTCHLAVVIFPPLPQPKLVLDLATPERCRAEFTWSITYVRFRVSVSVTCVLIIQFTHVFISAFTCYIFCMRGYLPMCSFLAREVFTGIVFVVVILSVQCSDAIWKMFCVVCTDRLVLLECHSSMSAAFAGNLSSFIFFAGLVCVSFVCCFCSHC